MDPIPCPFCGCADTNAAHDGTDDEENDPPFWHWVECDECGAQTDGYRTPEDALAAWNRRVATAKDAA